jgi:hypothetical protein
MPKPAKRSTGELAMTAQLHKYPGWVPEYAFCPGRRWRFDLANPALRLAIEIDGGTGAQRHGAVWHRAKDYEKSNEAIARGWRVLHGTTEMAMDGSLLKFVKRCMRE